MIFWVVITCLWTAVFGQLKDGSIVFPSNNIINHAPSAASNPNPSLSIVNADSGNCKCVPIGTCPPGGIGEFIDVRIVNNGLLPGNCQFGNVLCCPNNSTTTMDSTCGIRKITPTPQPVVGQTSFGAYPWHAIIITKQELYLGSGVLLDSTHIVTAAHKVNAFVNNPTMILVRLGEWNTQNNNEPYPSINLNVAKIIIHPSFNANNLENDVAVVKLNGMAPIASYPNINTACKPLKPPAIGTRCYVSGLGKNAFGANGMYQSIIKEVDVPILDINDCENYLRQTRLGANYVLNKNTFICAGGESGKDACTGDGGAPLVCQRNNQWEVVGLVAWGIGCGTAGVPGVYTNFYNFLSWINQTIVNM
ncbi:PREDICTED: trypsin-3-like [Ceratosolen solmsi marchali]|uniref:Trypsin-3-like n=1 Tax=Ceratosolen solmsi marchali TaxID=326594 RepID=A0AAJ6YWD8_9HYME|nr:PREDICTED: trypsin-3-like [Ceratosolen solmsi marchali]